MDLEYLSLCSLDGNLFPFSSVSKEGSEIHSPSYPLRPTCPCFVFDPIVTRLQRAFVMMDAARSLFARRPFISRSEKSIVRAFGSLFLLLPAAAAAAVHFNVGGNEVQERWMKMCS